MRTYQAILTEMDERTRQHRRVKLSIAAVAALWVLFRFWSENMNVGRLIDNSTWLTGAVAGFGALALLTSLMSFKDFTEEMYYRIPGSRDADGEHRCIHCGHRGIHHHGEYRSNEKFADCSKCKTNLWKS